MQRLMGRAWTMIVRSRMQHGWASYCGSHHERNQDAVLAQPPLFAVADGVGGGSFGELASSQMLEWCRSIPSGAWKKPRALDEWISRADSVIAQHLRSVDAAGCSATTFAAVWMAISGTASIVHVGDTRVIHLQCTGTRVRVRPLTQDQTYANLGEEPVPGSGPDDPARMVGVGSVGQPKSTQVRMRENDMILICSDGLHRHVESQRMAQVASDGIARGFSCKDLAEALCLEAIKSGSQDDTSAVLLRLCPFAGVRRPLRMALTMTILLALVTVLYRSVRV